jgi:hypothetical protein
MAVGGLSACSHEAWPMSRSFLPRCVLRITLTTLIGSTASELFWWEQGNFDVGSENRLNRSKSYSGMGSKVSSISEEFTKAHLGTVMRWPTLIAWHGTYSTIGSRRVASSTGEDSRASLRSSSDTKARADPLQERCGSHIACFSAVLDANRTCRPYCGRPTTIPLLRTSSGVLGNRD